MKSKKMFNKEDTNSDKNTLHNNFVYVFFQKLLYYMDIISEWIYEGPFHFICKYFDKKFIKFLFVGSVNTVFGYLMYVIFITMPIPRIVALLCSYIAGVLWNFKTTGNVVFKSNDNRLIFRFVFSYIVVFFINYAALVVLLNLNMNKYLAQFLLVFPVAMISFTLFRLFVFREKKQN